MYKIGIDVGSTTVKVVVIDENGNEVFTGYERHNARIGRTLCGMLEKASGVIGSDRVKVGLTGSIGMGIASSSGLPFVQEVVAASKAAERRCSERISSMVDIGGEDAKVVFFNEKGEPSDLRMNGNCAAGTGAFIDQMALILGESVESLSDLALEASHVYPIASRCGVFCKTDIQNLIAKNVGKPDIAASIFHAVAVQTVVTLAHGYEIKPPVLFCGGPLTFIPALRKAFTEYLRLSEKDVIVPSDGRLFPAIGAAVLAESDEMDYEALMARLEQAFNSKQALSSSLPQVFSSPEEYSAWKKRISPEGLSEGELKEGPMDVYLGIDSGSTTTKVVFTDSSGRLLFKYYAPNGGNPVETASRGLSLFDEKCREKGTLVNIKGSCSTGYGEDLMKASFRLDFGIIETIAHYMAASHVDPKVSFILDIGGQDMKAIYVDHGVINRIEINEACSSGCGSFIETFARSLGYKVSEFAQMACTSAHPCDLGTRCTVFMNSKVKQVLREGYGPEDISAGLAYSVVKNCLYKVLKLKDVSSLGSDIVVQGGTMKNDAVVRVLEMLTGAKVSRSDFPELMGAYGCALYAIENTKKTETKTCGEKVEIM